MNYEFKTKPYDHQKKEIAEHWNDKGRGLFFEMGLGKTKIMIDTMSILYMTERIDFALVIAPNGVQRNWATEELPVHMPDAIYNNAKILVYESSKAKNKSFKKQVDALKNHTGLKILLISYDAVRTTSGHALAMNLVKSNKNLIVLDESHKIKNPKAQVTKKVTLLGDKSDYKRILSGTPVPNGPFDAYSQLSFLDKNAFKHLGVSNFHTFRYYFGVFEKGYRKDKQGNVREFDQVVRYKNENKLADIIEKLGKRIMTEEVIDLPPKIYTKRFYKMSPKQRKVYDNLIDNELQWLEVGDGLGLLEPGESLPRMLKLQQTICNYVPVEMEDDYLCEKTLVNIDEENHPRMDLLKEIIEEEIVDKKAIIWCRFKKDIQDIKKMLGDSAVTHYGEDTTEARELAKSRFRDDDSVQFFICNKDTAAEGLTLVAAKYVIYYSNDFNLGTRLQSEKRAHRIGQDSKVTFIDLVCEDTIDEDWVTKMVTKQEISAGLTRDKYREWLKRGRK